MKCFPALKLPKFSNLKLFKLSLHSKSRDSAISLTEVLVTDTGKSDPTSKRDGVNPMPATECQSGKVAHHDDDNFITGSDPPTGAIYKDPHCEKEGTPVFGTGDAAPLTNTVPVKVKQNTHLPNDNCIVIDAFNHTNSQVDSNGTQISAVGIGNNIIIQNRNDGPRDQLRALFVIDAMHTGNVRPDPLRCDPNTRQDILLDITSWIENEDRDHDILWLTGPAGIGKSAIAMSTAEKLSQPDSKAKIASFFFFRTDPRRNGVAHFVPTIAYQLAVGIKDVGEEIDRVIAEDPTVLSATLEVQWERLIINTVRTVSTREPCTVPPTAVIIDGLDECADVEQNRVLGLLSCSPCLPLVFIIASRPEPHIVGSFDVDPLASRCRTRIDLAEFKNFAEMRSFIRSQFDRIYNKRRCDLLCYASCSEDGLWPSNKVVDIIAHRADGQYIYPTTLFKYMNDNNYNPHERLQACIEQSPDALSPLDALYIQIMRSSHKPQDERLKDLLFLVCTLATQHSLEEQQVLSGTAGQTLLSSYWHTFQLTLGRLALLLYSDRARCRQVLKRLHSVLSIPRIDDGGVHIYHKSFLDFLYDPRRSKDYHIDQQSRATRVIILCLNKLERGNYNDNSWFLIALWWRCSGCLSGTPIPGDLALQLRKLDFNKLLYLLMKSGPWGGFENDYNGFINVCNYWNEPSLRDKFDSGALAHAVFADWLRRNYFRIYSNDDSDETDAHCPLSWNALLAFGKAYVKSYAELEGPRTQVDIHTWLENMNPNNVVLASLTVFADPTLLLMFNKSDIEELYTWSKGWIWTPPKPLYPSLHTQWTTAGLHKIKTGIFNILEWLPIEHHYHERNGENVLEWLEHNLDDLPPSSAEVLTHWKSGEYCSRHLADVEMEIVG